MTDLLRTQSSCDLPEIVGSNLDYLDYQSEDESPSPTERAKGGEDVDWCKVVLKILLFVGLFVAITGLLEHLCDKQVTRISKLLMHHLGLPGLFIAVLLADGFPQPFTYVPLIFLAVKSNVSKPHVFGVCAVASYTAGWMGYLLGWNVRRFQWTRALMNKLTLKYPMVPQLMERRGAAGVALAALLPVPLAMATWTAGSFRIRLLPFAFAVLMRLPKITVFVLLSRPAEPDHLARQTAAMAGPLNESVRVV